MNSYLSNCKLSGVLRKFIHTHHKDIGWDWVTLSQTFFRRKSVVTNPIPKNIHSHNGVDFHDYSNDLVRKLYFTHNLVFKFPVQVIISFNYIYVDNKKKPFLPFNWFVLCYVSWDTTIFSCILLPKIDQFRKG